MKVWIYVNSTDYVYPKLQPLNICHTFIVAACNFSEWLPMQTPRNRGNNYPSTRERGNGQNK